MLLCNSEFADPYVLFFDPKYLGIHWADFDDLTTIRIRKMSSTTFISFRVRVRLSVSKVRVRIRFIILNSKNRKSCVTMVEIAKYHGGNSELTRPKNC